MLYTLISNEAVKPYATACHAAVERGTDRHTRFRLHMQCSRLHPQLYLQSHTPFGVHFVDLERVWFSFFFLASTYHVPEVPFAHWSFRASDPTASTVRSVVG